LSQKDGSAIGTQGLVTSAKIHKPAPIMMSPTKKQNPKLSNFLKPILEDFPHL